MSRITAAELRSLSKQPRVRNVAPKQDRTYNGRVYMSKAEALHAFELDAQKAAGEINYWEPQVAYPIMIEGKLICKMVVDFRVYLPGGSIEIHEVKGWETEIFKLKLKLFRACYPYLKYVIIKA